jgi:hypothetical protein
VKRDALMGILLGDVVVNEAVCAWLYQTSMQMMGSQMKVPAASGMQCAKESLLKTRVWSATLVGARLTGELDQLTPARDVRTAHQSRREIGVSPSNRK